MSGLYDADVLEWSKHQAALLRRRAAGELALLPTAESCAATLDELLGGE